MSTIPAGTPGGCSPGNGGATPIGLWIDCPPPAVCQPIYWEALARLGIDCAAVMVESSRAGWTPTWTTEQLAAAIRLAMERDIEVVVTVWPEPREDDLSACLTALDGWAQLGVVGVEVDLEGQWMASRLRGYPTMAAAADALVSGLRAIRERHDVRVEVTTHTGHGECGPHALVSPHVDRVIPQLYSTRRDWRQRAVEWTGPMGPGRRQREWLGRQERPGLAIPRLGQPAGPLLSVGLAAWSQVWPGHTVAEAMGAAYDAALHVDPAEVRWWSSKWVVGSRRLPAVAAWLAEIR